MIEGKRHDLWSTPIWELQTEFDDEFNNKLLIESNNPDFDDFKNIWSGESECIQIMKTYIKQVVGSIDPTLSLGNGWFYKSNINESLPVHHHGGVFMAVVYYVSIPENSGNLLFIDPRGGVNWYGTEYGNSISSGVIPITPKKGKLVIFPGYLFHMTEPNLSSETRVTLVTNIWK